MLAKDVCFIDVGIVVNDGEIVVVITGCFVDFVGISSLRRRRLFDLLQHVDASEIAHFSPAQSVEVLAAIKVPSNELALTV